MWSLTGTIFAALGVESVVWAVLPSSTRMFPVRVFIYLFIYFGSMRIQELERLKQPKIQWGRGKIGKLGRACMASRWAGRRLHGWALEMMSPAFLIMGKKTFCYSYQLPSTEFDACIHAKNMDRVLMRDTQDSYWKVIRAFLDTTNNLIEQEGLYLQVAWFQI